MIAVVHQALGDVVFADARFLVHLAALQYHFVADKAVCPAINDAIGILEACSQVVGVQDGRLGGACQSFRTHHADVAVSDGQDARTAERCCRNFIGGIAEQSVPRQERNQMLCHADRAYARSAAAVRRRECLVQVQVAYIGADKSGVGQSHLCIHVGAVHIHLRAAGMDNLADFHDFRFKDAVGGGVGNHQRGKAVLVLFGFGAEVGHVNVALFVAGAGNGGETGLDGGSRVGAVRRSGYQHLVAVSLPDALLIGADYAQPRILSGSAGIGLQAYAGKSGYHFQFLAEVVYKLAVAFRLVFGNERVHAHEFRTAEGQHLRGGVQLHGARAERNHGVRQ